MTEDILCLTIRNPWALAIFVAGKDIENRSWYTAVRGRVAIHSSQDMGRGEFDAAVATMWRAGIKFPMKYEKACRYNGVVLGTVNIVGCEMRDESPWYQPGNFAFRLADPIMHKEPIVRRGKLGFWRLCLPEAAA